MPNRMTGIMLLVALLMTCGAQAMAERRFALVVGINDYSFIQKLETAVGDARAMAAKLDEMGFDVTTVIDPNRRALNIAIAKFVNKLTRDDIAFVHFSGHGVEIDGTNYLLPADIPNPESGYASVVKYEGVRLRRLIGQVSETNARARVFVFDACRDNPFNQPGRTIGSPRGFARIEAPSGTFIMYSAGYQQKALDRLGPQDEASTSVYTRVLLDKIAQPGKPIARIAREVRNQVTRLARTAGFVQRPAYYDELSAPLVLSKAVAAPPATDRTSRPGGQQIEFAIWREVKAARNPAALKAFMKQYPNSVFYHLAVGLLAEIEAENSAGTAKQQPVASIPAEPARPEALPPFDAEDETVIRKVQDKLYSLGYKIAAVDGKWGPNSAAALKNFQTDRSLAATGKADRAVYDALMAQPQPKPWGAIVYSTTSATWGMSWGHEGRKAAEQEAIKTCGTNNRCRSVFAFAGKACAAFVVTGRQWIVRTAPGVKAAIRRAKSVCQSPDHPECGLIAHVCADGSEKFAGG